MNFDNDYDIIYGKNRIKGLYDWLSYSFSNIQHVSEVLDFDNTNNTWTENDHIYAYETFFGDYKKEYEHILKLPQNELIEELKIKTPNTWEIYFKIINFYSNKNTIHLANLCQQQLAL